MGGAKAADEQDRAKIPAGYVYLVSPEGEIFQGPAAGVAQLKSKGFRDATYAERSREESRGKALNPGLMFGFRNRSRR